MKFAIHGLKELDNALRELRSEMAGAEGKIVPNAMRAAAKKTVLPAQQMAASKHRDTGRLFKALSIKRHPNPTHWNELFGVGVHNMGKRPRKGEGDNGDQPWYAWIVEYGGWGKSGPLRGFMRRSLEENREKYEKQYARELGTRIERAARKIGRKDIQAVGAKARRL